MKSNPLALLFLPPPIPPHTPSLNPPHPSTNPPHPSTHPPSLLAAPKPGQVPGLPARGGHWDAGLAGVAPAITISFSHKRKGGGLGARRRERPLMESHSQKQL